MVCRMLKQLCVYVWGRVLRKESEMCDVWDVWTCDVNMSVCIWRWLLLLMVGVVLCVICYLLTVWWSDPSSLGCRERGFSWSVSPVGNVYSLVQGKCCLSISHLALFLILPCYYYGLSPTQEALTLILPLKPLYLAPLIPPLYLAPLLNLLLHITMVFPLHKKR